MYIVVLAISEQEEEIDAGDFEWCYWSAFFGCKEVIAREVFSPLLTL